MVNKAAAKKRIRLNEERRLVNKAKNSEMKTSIKKVFTAVEAGDVEEAKKALPQAFKKIDKAAKTNVIHENTASRRKARVSNAVVGLEKKA